MTGGKAERAWRMRVPDRGFSFVDRVQGESKQHLQRDVGDFFCCARMGSTRTNLPWWSMMRLKNSPSKPGRRPLIRIREAAYWSLPWDFLDTSFPPSCAARLLPMCGLWRFRLGRFLGFLRYVESFREARRYPCRTRQPDAGQILEFFYPSGCSVSSEKACFDH